MSPSPEQAGTGQPASYRVVVRGALPGHETAQVAARLAAVFRRSAEQMLVLLAAPHAIIRKQLDHAGAQRYREALEQCGCACGIEAEEPDFSGLALRRFASPGIGIVLNAPAAWRSHHDGHVYHLHDMASGSQLSAIGVANSNLTVQDWNELRVRKVAEEMGWLRPARRPYQLEGGQWGPRMRGIATEYQGTLPGLEQPSRYLLLSLWTPQALACLTIHAPASAFERHEALYRWLLRTQLSVQERAPGPVHDEAMARWLRYNKVGVGAGQA